MKLLISTFLIILLPLISFAIPTSKLPDPRGPVCMVYAQWAFDRVKLDPQVQWAEIIGGTLEWEPRYVHVNSWQSSHTPYFTPAPEVQDNLRHAVCFWQKGNDIWEEDTWVNNAVPYKTVIVTEKLRSGQKLTPTIMFTVVHRHATEIVVLQSYKSPHYKNNLPQ